MRRKLLRSQSGAVFIESVIAAGILIFVLVSVLALSSQALRYLANIRLTARSTQVLQQKMEDIRLLSWSSIQSLPGTFTDPSDTNNTFSGTVTSQDYDAYNGTPTVKRLTLTVTWIDRNQRSATNTLTTLIANGGLNKYFF